MKINKAKKDKSERNKKKQMEQNEKSGGTVSGIFLVQPFAPKVVNFFLEGGSTRTPKLAVSLFSRNNQN